MWWVYSSCNLSLHNEWGSQIGKCRGGVNGPLGSPSDLSYMALFNVVSPRLQPTVHQHLLASIVYHLLGLFRSSDFLFEWWIGFFATELHHIRLIIYRGVWVLQSTTSVVLVLEPFRCIVVRFMYIIIVNRLCLSLLWWREIPQSFLYDEVYGSRFPVIHVSNSLYLQYSIDIVLIFFDSKYYAPAIPDLALFVWYVG